jgi:hypothetical protein
MITEEEKERLQKEKIEQTIKICEEAISKAEKYERLKDNPDWRGYLTDLKVIADLHDKEIEWGKSMLIDAPSNGYLKMGSKGTQEYVSSREDWVQFIVRHHIQKQECTNWIKEPEHILTMAAMAREKLPMLKDKIAELSNAAVVNGKS